MQGQAAEPLPGKARPPGVPLGRRGTPAKAGVRRSRWVCGRRKEDREKMGYELIYIDERAEWLEKAAAWFHQKWGIPLEAYRESMEERGTKMLYLLTDHIRFYERYGWEYLCDAMGEGEDTPSWMYRKSTE